ncbi:glycine-rich cell wall structural protein 1-like isoform X1 [Lytechinus variegatus]|uniref:glycine-rich cell wall structural protein 1-like isoform X1 n=1 Tax=Lytechinus variegatus TaxID=7654 RepID=UPI001BB121E1|nr:glycine-rich cell wall structural protein 1-like isoform X1 [Lytechinus variegatus]
MVLTGSATAMKGHLIIKACSAQFDWLMNYRQLNAGAPQRQTDFGFMKPSTTPKPLGALPKKRRDGTAFGLGAANEFAGGSSSYTNLDTAPVDAGIGDTSGGNAQGSDWDINAAGTDYGGNSNGGDYGGTGGVSGGNGGGFGGGSNGEGGSFAEGGNLNPGYDDSMQNLANASAGSIAGIVIGVIILLCVLAGVSFFVMRQVHRKVQVNATRA